MNQAGVLVLEDEVSDGVLCDFSDGWSKKRVIGAVEVDPLEELFDSGRNVLLPDIKEW